jgi:hypothetical protein
MAEMAAGGQKPGLPFQFGARNSIELFAKAE